KRTRRADENADSPARLRSRDFHSSSGNSFLCIGQKSEARRLVGNSAIHAATTLANAPVGGAHSQIAIDSAHIISGRTISWRAHYGKVSTVVITQAKVAAL